MSKELSKDEERQPEGPRKGGPLKMRVGGEEFVTVTRWLRTPPPPPPPPPPW